LKTANYKVNGMTCEGCVASITKALEMALAEATVEVQLEGGQIRVFGDHEAALVAETVRAAGFDFGGAQAG
jgi:copper chaperone